MFSEAISVPSDGCKNVLPKYIVDSGAEKRDQ